MSCLLIDIDGERLYAHLLARAEFHIAAAGVSDSPGDWHGDQADYFSKLATHIDEDEEYALDLDDFDRLELECEGQTFGPPVDEEEDEIAF